jgi:hypothetical protein
MSAEERARIREAMAQDLRRQLDRLSELGRNLRCEEPRDEAALKQLTRIRGQVRRELKRLEQPPKLYIHFHFHREPHVGPPAEPRNAPRTKACRMAWPFRLLGDW